MQDDPQVAMRPSRVLQPAAENSHQVTSDLLKATWPCMNGAIAPDEHPPSQPWTLIDGQENSVVCAPKP